MRNIVMLVLAGGFLIGGPLMGGNTLVMAQEKAEVKAVDVGNKICPVMGGPSSEKITAEYKGKLYRMCCSGCVQAFNKDPEKFSKIADDEVVARQSK